MIIKILSIIEVLFAISSVLSWFAGLYFVVVNQLSASLAAFIIFCGFVFSSGRAGDLRCYLVERQSKPSKNKDAPYQDY